MEFGTESGTDEPKNALCPNCEQPVNGVLAGFAAIDYEMRDVE